MDTIEYQLGYSANYHSGAVRCLSLSSNNILLSSGWDGTSIMCNYDPDKRQYLFYKGFSLHTGAIYSSCPM